MTPKEKALELVNKFDVYNISNFEIVDYQSHPAIKAPLSN